MSAESKCEHEWEILDVKVRTFGDYSALYHGQGQMVTTRFDFTDTPMKGPK